MGAHRVVVTALVSAMICEPCGLLLEAVPASSFSSRRSDEENLCYAVVDTMASFQISVATTPGRQSKVPGRSAHTVSLTSYGRRNVLLQQSTRTGSPTKKDPFAEKELGGPPYGNGTKSVWGAIIPIWKTWSHNMQGKLNDDVFPERKKVRKELTVFRAPADEWFILACTVAALIILDGLVLRCLPQTSVTSVVMLIFHLCAAIGYNAYFFARYGDQAAFDWCSGYVLEWLLSIDNIFVFHLIFRFYQVPHGLHRYALLIGLVGAVTFRLALFSSIGYLVRLVVWVRIVFGLLLIYSGAMAAWQGEAVDDDVSQTYAVRCLRTWFGSRLKETYDDTGSFFVRDNGVLKMTLLVYVIAVLEVTDLVFAVDSVSAKVAQIHDQYIAFSSTAIAMLGLRAMFFIVNDMVEYFEMLKYGICILLIFIGVELILADFIRISSGSVCIIIVAVFVTCIVASIARKWKHSSFSSPSPPSSAKEARPGGEGPANDKTDTKGGRAATAPPAMVPPAL